MKNLIKFSAVFVLFLSVNSFALSLGSIQRNQAGEVVGATQSEASSMCYQKGLKLPTPQELVQIAADKSNTGELKNAAFWSSEKGTVLMGDYGFVADGYDWAELTAGVICR